MLCGKCGKENPEGAKFCEACGEELAAAVVEETVAVEEPAVEVPVEEIQTPAEEAPVAEENYGEVSEKPANKLSIAKIIVAVVAIIVVIFGLKAIFGKGPEDVVKNQVKAINKAKVSYALKVMPKGIAKEIKKDDDKIEEMEEAMEKTKELLKDRYGKNVKMSYKILDKEKIDKDDIEDYEDDYNDAIEEYNEENDTKLKDVKISKGYKLEVKYIIKGKDDKDSNISSVTVLKINGKWCAYDLSSLY